MNKSNIEEVFDFNSLKILRDDDLTVWILTSKMLFIQSNKITLMTTKKQNNQLQVVWNKKQKWLKEQ